MSAGSKVGKNYAVKLGANTILGIASVSLDGQSNETLDNTEFGDNVRKFLMGIRDGGTISLSGNYKPADNTGQRLLRQKFLNQVDITDLRIYIDDTSYLEPCQTTGYFDPTSTTGNDTQLSYVQVQDHSNSAETGAIGKWACSLKVSGDYVLV